jgi:hypothetical protein
VNVKGFLLLMLVAGVATAWLLRRRYRTRSKAPPVVQPVAPLVLPGDHSLTPLFPALDEKVSSWGFINDKGTFVIAPQYAGADAFSEGLAFVHTTDGRQLCIDKNNREQFDLRNPLPTGWIVPEVGFREGFALLIVQGTGEGNRYTYVDRTGRLLGPPRFFPARSFSGGLAAVALDGRWGALGRDGAMAIPFGDREVGDFVDGLASLHDRAPGGFRAGFIDATGHQIIPSRYELAGDFGDGLAPVQLSPSNAPYRPVWGYLDRTGRLVIAARFPSARNFSEGRAAVCEYQKGRVQPRGFIDTTGKLVIPGRYQHANEFHGGLAAVHTGFKWGYVDRDGNEIVPLTLDCAADFVDGLARVRSKRTSTEAPREGYLDARGAWVCSWPYDDRPHGSRVDFIPASQL